jgi:hypothetical protein
VARDAQSGCQGSRLRCAAATPIGLTPLLPWMGPPFRNYGPVIGLAHCPGGWAQAGKEPRTHARARGCNAHTHAHTRTHTRIMHAHARAREGTPSHYVDRVVVANSISIKNNRCVEFE